MVRVKLMLGTAYLIAQASGALKTQSPPLIDAFAEIMQIYQQLKAFTVAAENLLQWGRAPMSAEMSKSS